MGLTYVEGKVTGPTGATRTVDFLIDSGATYSLLPQEVWQDLGLQPTESYKFVLADGTKIERGVSECRIALNGTERHSPVILGVPGDEPLIGAVTLEVLGLVLDPFQRKLQAMKMRLG
ncbi:MAG: aspartyl protease family protein [Pirellulales bacterium]